MSKLEDGTGEVLSVVAKFAGPVAEELGQLVRDQVRYFRAKNLLNIFKKTKQLLADAGIEPQPVPPRLLLPAIEAASGEDDELLQDRWANLLVNAASPGAAHVLPSFVETLKQMTPEEAVVLDKLHRIAVDTERFFGPKARAMYDRGIAVGTFNIISGKIAIGAPTKSETDAERTLRRESEALVIDDLVRLGLLDRIQYQGPKQESLTAPPLFPGDTIYMISPFALAFMSACTAPRRKDKNVTGVGQA